MAVNDDAMTRVIDLKRTGIFKMMVSVGSLCNAWNLILCKYLLSCPRAREISLLKLPKSLRFGSDWIRRILMA
jgi:hypothetical protein